MRNQGSGYGVAAASATYELLFGAQTTPNSATSWLYYGALGLGAPSATVYEYEVSKPGTLSDFYIMNGRLSGAVNVTYAFFKNGIATIVGILNSGSSAGAAIAGTVTVVTGDRLSVSVTNAGILLGNAPAMRMTMTEA